MFVLAAILIVLTECVILLVCAGNKQGGPGRKRNKGADQKHKSRVYRPEDSNREYPEARKARGADSKTSVADLNNVLDSDPTPDLPLDPQKASKSHESSETTADKSNEDKEQHQVPDSDRAWHRLKEKKAGVPTKFIQQDERDLSLKLKPRDYDQRARPLGRCVSFVGKVPNLPAKCLDMIGVKKEEKKKLEPKIEAETPETRRSSMNLLYSAESSDVENQKRKSTTPPKNSDFSPKS